MSRMKRSLLLSTALSISLALVPADVVAQQAPVPMEVNTVLLAPTVLSAAGDVVVPTGELPAVGLSIQGTYSGLTAAVQGQTSPGGSWATIPAIPFGGGATVTSISANGRIHVRADVFLTEMLLPHG
jgi:hypothetical protein